MFGGSKNFDRVAVRNAYRMSADRRLLKAQIVCGRLELILAGNGKDTRENKQCNKSDGHRGANRAK